MYKLFPKISKNINKETNNKKTEKYIRLFNVLKYPNYS